MSVSFQGTTKLSDFFGENFYSSIKLPGNFTLRWKIMASQGKYLITKWADPVIHSSQRNTKGWYRNKVAIFKGILISLLPYNFLGVSTLVTSLGLTLSCTEWRLSPTVDDREDHLGLTGVTQLEFFGASTEGLILGSVYLRHLQWISQFYWSSRKAEVDGLQPGFPAMVRSGSLLSLQEHSRTPLWNAQWVSQCIFMSTSLVWFYMNGNIISP